MKVILGIDAAWTATQPSGVALVRSDGTTWRCVAAAPSYDAFIGLSSGKSIDWRQSQLKGCKPDANGLLDAARRLAGSEVDIVAVDMPVSKEKISGRREADRAVSREFGGRKCSTHSPNCDRPGLIGEGLSAGFCKAGFELSTANTEKCDGRHLLEVYPHTALLALLPYYKERVRYKISKASRFWQSGERIDQVLRVFAEIYQTLNSAFGCLTFTLPTRRDAVTLTGLKRYEDALDALICAWVGVQFLDGKTVPMGDETSAIWCPRDVVRNSTPTAA